MDRPEQNQLSSLVLCKGQVSINPNKICYNNYNEKLATYHIRADNRINMFSIQEKKDLNRRCSR